MVREVLELDSSSTLGASCMFDVPLSGCKNGAQVPHTEERSFAKACVGLFIVRLRFWNGVARNECSR